MNHNRSGSSFLADQGKQRRPSRSKPRLPVFQRFAFSVGHVLNDTVMGAWISYLLIFQTKVLGLSNRTAGFLWIVTMTVDSVLCIVVGYICDNYKFPLLARYYGKRKSFHLLGTVLVAGFFPLLMMPCFVCGKDSTERIMGIYYGTIMIVLNIGWALSQVTHLALIPEIAKRPNEMVELHALRSGFTFLSGIFMYAITWIVLRTDGSSENITYSQWKDFMEMAVIVVGTGCVFSLIFHVGIHEPPQTIKEKNKGPSGKFIGQERQSSRTSTLPLPDKTVGVFCLYDENELTAASAKTEGKEVIQVEQADIAIENGTVKDRSVDSQEKKSVELRVSGLEKGQNSNEFSFSNPAFQNDGRLDVVCEKTVDSLNEDPVTQPPSAGHTEQTKKHHDFSFSNPAFLREDKQITDVDVPGERSQTGKDFQSDDSMQERQSTRSGSSGSSEGYASSPETDSVDSIDCACTDKARTENSEHRKQEICAADQTRPGSVTKEQIRPSSVTKGSDTSFCCVSVIIEEVHEHETKKIKTTKSWTDWFKTPLFYKISFAFMCARLVQILNSSYVPLYLTDTLGFEKESIAYFPLVILISGVFSSLCAKKLDKMLGDKWTYSLAAVLVAGSSAWFYLQTESGRNAVYCAAILVGCGGSVMYVTSMALAGKLIGENKESGAFVFASMAVLAKVACGIAIFIIQEFFPPSGDCGEYVRYVFSVGPGTGSVLGFLVVIAFLPATVRCRKVVHTVDSSVQTEAVSAEVLYAYDNPAAIDRFHVTSSLSKIQN